MTITYTEDIINCQTFIYPFIFFEFSVTYSITLKQNNKIFLAMSSGQYDWAKNIPCRNIQIHGFCKFEHKGCSYNHDPALQKISSVSPVGANETPAPTGSAGQTAITSTSADSTMTSSSILNPQFQQVNGSSSTSSPATSLSTDKNIQFKPSSVLNKIANSNDSTGVTANKFNLNSPAFTPSAVPNKFTTLSPSLEKIPTFVPSNSSSSPLAENTTIASALRNNLNKPTASTPISTTNGPSGTPTSTENVLNNETSMKQSLSKANSFNPITAPVFTPQGATPSTMQPNEFIQPINTNYTPPSGEELFYQNTNLYPVNFLLYAPPPPPHVDLNKKPNERTVDDLFISSKLREYLQLKNEESLKSISNNELDLPSHVGKYHSLYPIDHNFEYSTKSFGYISIVYKCMSNEDGKLYTMRRLQNVPISSASELKSIKRWKKVDCANCVKVYDVFTTRAFNDNSLIFIYDYFPMSLTLLENHFMSFPGKNPDLITEDSLWNYTIQLLNAITEVHKLGLSLGPLDSSKIIITNKGRIRLSSVGIKNVLDDVRESLPDDAKAKVDAEKLEESKQSDLLNLGKLILFLAKSTTFIKNPSDDPRELIPQLKFTNVFKKMLTYLFTEDATVEKFQELVAPMILKLANGLQNSCDYMESNLTSELENARLVRLFAKLDFISERPELVKEGLWSETGDRYPIKLFKDYVFHQVDDNGKPVIDLTHVINCMNKLDAGVDENILLVSPDELTCLIMSYKDLKELINKSFLKLLGKE